MIYVYQILFHFPLPGTLKKISCPSLLCRQMGSRRLVLPMGCKQMLCVNKFQSKHRTMNSLRSFSCCRDCGSHALNWQYWKIWILHEHG